MLEPTLDDYTTYAGRATRRGGVVLLAKEREADPSSTDESPSFLFAVKDDTVSATQIDWHVRSICFVDAAMPQLYCIGRRGRVHVVQDTPYEEVIDDTPDDPLRRGALIDAALIGDHLYACGMGRQVYRRTLDLGAVRGTWTLISHAIIPQPGDLRPVALAAITGFADDEIYAGGWNGELFVFDGAAWRPVMLPTNLDLHALICEPTGRVIGAGQHGLVALGRSDCWTVLDQTETGADFWSCTVFAGQTWLATEQAVYRLDGDTLIPVSVNDDPNLTTGRLTADNVRLWSVGADHVFSTSDGRIWEQLRL